VTPAGGAVVQIGDGWLVDGVLISTNHGCGMGMGGGDAWTVSNSTLTYNGKSGYCGPSTNATFGPNNTVSYNNQDYFNVAWGAGAGKMSGAGPITIIDNTFSHNLGNGLWFDDGYHNAIVTGNTMDSNTHFPPDGIRGGDGIRVEVSCFITITNNVVTNNGRTGINLSNSHDVTVGGVGAGNTVSGNTNGEVRVAFHGRAGTGFCAPLSSKNNLIINNAMTMSGTDSVGIASDATCNGCFRGTLFTGNTYAGRYCADLLWNWWDGRSQQSIDFPTWQSSYKQDLTGKC
jgi:parallel beta-helix repeat protein